MPSLYALYRYFDDENRLLYIGISGDMAVRDSAHIAMSRWMQLTASSTIKRFETLGEVKAAEQEAVEAEHPLFNVQYNDTPEARERLRTYLEEIGRIDLLAPKLAKSTGGAADAPAGFQLPGTFADVEKLWDPIDLPAVIRITDGACQIEISRGYGITLRISGAGPDITMRFDNWLAQQIGQTLEAQATAYDFEQVFHPA